MTSGISIVLIAVSETTTWGWGSPKTIAVILVGLAVSAAWIAVEVRSRNPLIDMTMMRISRRVDDQAGRVPARGGHVCVVHRVSAVRPAADEHRLRASAHRWWSRACTCCPRRSA